MQLDRSWGLQKETVMFHLELDRTRASSSSHVLVLANRYLGIKLSQSRTRLSVMFRRFRFDGSFAIIGLASVSTLA